MKRFQYTRTFPHPNQSDGWTCPICLTNKDFPVVLMPIPDTGNGELCEARQVHAGCIEFGLNETNHTWETIKTNVR